MLPLLVPTAASGIHLVATAADAYMWPSTAGTFVAAEVVVPPHMHCLPAAGAATAVVVDVVSITPYSIVGAGAATVADCVAAVVSGAVAVGVAT